MIGLNAEMQAPTIIWSNRSLSVSLTHGSMRCYAGHEKQWNSCRYRLKIQKSRLISLCPKRIKRLAGFKDTKSDVNKLAHGGTGNGLAVLAIGFEAFAEIMNDRIMFPGCTALAYTTPCARLDRRFWRCVFYLTRVPIARKYGGKTGKSHDLFGG